MICIDWHVRKRTPNSTLDKTWMDTKDLPQIWKFKKVNNEGFFCNFICISGLRNVG